MVNVATGSRVRSLLGREAKQCGGTRRVGSTCRRFDHKIDRSLANNFCRYSTHVRKSDAQNARTKIIESVSALNQAIEASRPARNEYPSIVVSQLTPLLCCLRVELWPILPPLRSTLPTHSRLSRL